MRKRLLVLMQPVRGRTNNLGKMFHAAQLLHAPVEIRIQKAVIHLTGSRLREQNGHSACVGLHRKQMFTSLPPRRLLFLVFMARLLLASRLIVRNELLILRQSVVH